MKGHVAAAVTLALALAVAIFAYGMPAPQALAAAGFGFAYGLWPIAWIIVTRVPLQDRGQDRAVRRHPRVGAVDHRRPAPADAADRLCLRRVSEGAAGFGAPVAITAALLVGLASTRSMRPACA
jgi:lactate permease